MATRDDLLDRYVKLGAFKGLTRTDIGVYLDLALEAVEGYAPKKVKLKKIPRVASDKYTVPSAARSVLAAYVSDSNMEIEMRVEETPTYERSYFLLGLKVPSWIDMMSDERGNVVGRTSVFSGHRYGVLSGSTHNSHDLEYTVKLRVEDLDARQLQALRLYAESEGYEYQATKSSNLSDIVDREASGASTTIRRSQSGGAYQKLAMARRSAFVKEVARPYFSTDTFGTTEYVWSEGI